MDAFPPLFLSHGSPMIALQPREAGRFMQRLGPALVQRFGRPRAVLAVSAHSLARQPLLLAAPRHAAVHDFGHFDPRLFALRYDAPGAPALAQDVAARLRAAGAPVDVLEHGGLDHGIWTVLRWMFPQADVPVLPLAWPPDAAPAELLALGRALAPLAGAGVLVLGTGSITHNLPAVFARGIHAADGPATPESLAFREAFAAAGAAADWDRLLGWRAAIPQAARMHPTDEHLLPFFVAAGAAWPAEAAPATALRLHASHTHGELGMDAYAFGPQAGALVQVLAGAAEPA
jgi:4,5-DOPA dioxygenase extradiol